MEEAAGVRQNRRVGQLAAANRDDRIGDLARVGWRAARRSSSAAMSA
jgi:hypothetical protein